MEGVKSVMPIAVKTGVGVLSQAISGGSGGTSNAAEQRAENVENQARRQAEAQARATREQVQNQREDNQHRQAAARVAAADSGVELSGSSLLNLTSLEHQGDAKVSGLMDESAVRIQSILDSGAEQARSIRLSGRVADNRLSGLGSLLRLGGQAQTGTPGTVPPFLNDDF
jgi:hypothetical protein